MGDAVKKALETVGKVASAVGLKKPWEITGIASTPDYFEYLPTARDYRRHAPGSQPVKAIIPHDVPQQVYDIKYYVRDYRRNSKYTARTVSASAPLDVEKLFKQAPLKPEDVKYTSRPDIINNRGY